MWWINLQRESTPSARAHKPNTPSPSQDPLRIAHAFGHNVRSARDQCALHPLGAVVPPDCTPSVRAYPHSEDLRPAQDPQSGTGSHAQVPTCRTRSSTIYASALRPPQHPRRSPSPICPLDVEEWGRAQQERAVEGGATHPPRRYRSQHCTRSEEACTRRSNLRQPVTIEIVCKKEEKRARRQRASTRQRRNPLSNQCTGQIDVYTREGDPPCRTTLHKGSHCWLQWRHRCDIVAQQQSRVRCCLQSELSVREFVGIYTQS